MELTVISLLINNQMLYKLFIKQLQMFINVSRNFIKFIQIMFIDELNTIQYYTVQYLFNIDKAVALK